jgi:sigma54-dependent transcription regulator
MHQDLRVDRLELIHGGIHEGLARYVTGDIAGVSPETEVRPRRLDFGHAWDFKEVYGKLLDFARDYPFDPDAEDYLVHITTGTHVAQICLFLLTKARYLPAKSQLARRIFELKRLKHQVSGAFVEVNCATLKGDSAMSALFGHKRGAFTGAAADRSGLLRTADKGVLFLDEIGELGLDEQAMILRAIEEKRFLPVGADKEASSEFQLLAGTNRDLGTAVSSGEFREDLFARLNLWTFELPRCATGWRIANRTSITSSTALPSERVCG